VRQNRLLKFVPSLCTVTNIPPRTSGYRLYILIASSAVGNLEMSRERTFIINRRIVEGALSLVGHKEHEERKQLRMSVEEIDCQEFVRRVVRGRCHFRRAEIDEFLIETR
jgi:hypothetical protein